MALSELSMFSQSVGLLHELLMGAGLTHPLHEESKPSESHWVRMQPTVHTHYFKIMGLHVYMYVHVHVSHIHTEHRQV